MNTLTASLVIETDTGFRHTSGPFEAKWSEYQDLIAQMPADVISVRFQAVASTSRYARLEDRPGFQFGFGGVEKRNVPSNG